MDIFELLRQRHMSSRELQSQLNLSQGAVSAKLNKLGSRVVRYNRGRTPMYALTRNAFGSDDQIPVYMADNYGNNTVVVFLRPLYPSGFYAEKVAGTPKLLLGESEDGLFGGLPYYLQNIRPQGYIGRQLALELSRRISDFPADLANWNENHIGRYLLSNGEDLPGNFQLGEIGFLRRRAAPDELKRSDYPIIAAQMESGENPGSSAGGEQPKFTAYCADVHSHVIVKFNTDENSSTQRRWRDILISEYCAQTVLAQHNYAAAKTEILHIENRTFLESMRFDRTGHHGRCSMISLSSVDAEFVGAGSTWPDVISKLNARGLVSNNHLHDTAVLHEFGRLINNTDMHLGNLSLGIDGEVFRLLPIYDMCSMGFAPVREKVRPLEFNAPTAGNTHQIAGIHSDVSEFAFNTAKSMTHDFWQLMLSQPELSGEFQDLAIDELQKG